MPTVVGLGEVLWDLLPSGRQLGGAPANFAYWSHVLGDRAVVASRVGADELGREVRRSLLARGITDRYLQTDQVNATGTVKVEVNAVGQPKFEIIQPVAWDFLEVTDEWKALAQSADAVCFGSLAQRSTQSRTAILQFLEATRREALRIFDVNMRQSFYSAEIIRESCLHANVLKLNHDELPRMREALAVAAEDALGFCEGMIRDFNLQLICVTRGANGSLLSNGQEVNEHPGFRVHVKDTVGSGDAFTAALVHGHLQGCTLAAMNDAANRLGAWVATNAGATPAAPDEGFEKSLEELRLN